MNVLDEAVNILLILNLVLLVVPRNNHLVRSEGNGVLVGMSGGRRRVDAWFRCERIAVSWLRPGVAHES